MDSLVSTEWLQAQLDAPDLAILDGSFFLPGSGRDARAEFFAAHIPGAVFFDIDDIANPASGLPHMLPPPGVFAEKARGLGLGDGQRIVVYDDSPLHSAARVWWTLRAFGLRDVAILDGGLQKWTAEGRPLQSGEPSSGPGKLAVAPQPDAAIAKDELLELVGAASHELVDARSAERFAGTGPEPRPGLASGHIPGAKNLPQGELFNEDHTWKRGAELHAAFDAAGVDLSKPMVTSCGSGVTAAVLLFGAHLLGKEGVRLYDGSWAEWGADPATPKERFE
ncbi:MAG: 3-mercaptopyruvate sulfurtransferase [Sphingosinicella sp.]